MGFNFVGRHAIFYDENCNICIQVVGITLIKYKVSSLIYDLFPSLWRWWVQSLAIINLKLWNRNKIYNEDCKITLKRLQDKSIDGIITSPPYNINTERSDCYYNNGYSELDGLSENDSRSKN